MPEEKKIIIDEDWKSRVHAEREALARDENQQPESPLDADTAGGDRPLPAASFEMLLSTLATEAMMALGQMPNPVSGKFVFYPNQAKYLIDTIDILREKTKGNLSPAESQGLENLLHQLRMAFLAGPPPDVQPESADSHSN